MRIKPYLVIVKNSFMSDFAYRGHLYFTFAGSIIYLIVSWFLWKAIYANGGTIGGLTFSQAYMYVGISIGISSIMQTDVDWQLHRFVSSGDIIRFLTKPIDFPLQLFADASGSGITNSMMIALPSFIVVYIISGAGLPSPAGILFFVISVAIGYLLNFFFDFLIGLTVFLTQSIGGVVMAKDTIVLFLSGAVVPLAFFPEGVRRVLNWLPFQALYNTPVRLLIDNSLGTGDVAILFLKQAGWLILFYLIVRIFFSKALKRLVVNGG
jgi:ABC-2 type transport system permease protein